MGLRDVEIGGRPNAIIGWMLVGVVVLMSVESFRRNAVLWAGFSLLLVSVAAFPALARREWAAMVPWPLLSIAAVAVIARTVRVYPEVAGYLALATLAIVIVVELVQFTPVELSRWFAIGFGVLTTLALEAFWIIAQFYSDVLLGSKFLTTQDALQQDILIVTVVGFAVGGFFLGLFELITPMKPTDRSVDEAP